MSTTSRTPAVIDALVATWTAITTTYDGPVAPTTWPTEFCFVGGTEVPGEQAVHVSIAWAGLGAKARNETGTVTCVLIVQSGATNIKTDRDRVFVLFGLFEAAVVADPTLGGSVQSGWLLPLEFDYTQRQNAQGSYARIEITVTYSARI